MSTHTKFETNAVGRKVPSVVNGREQTPFQGVGKYQPTGNKAGAPIRANKLSFIGKHPRFSVSLLYIKRRG